MEKYAELYEGREHEVALPDGRCVSYGRHEWYGIFIVVYDPGAEHDELGPKDKVLLDLNERINGATAVKTAFDEWVLDDPMDIEHLDPTDDEPWGAK